MKAVDFNKVIIYFSSPFNAWLYEVHAKIQCVIFKFFETRNSLFKECDNGMSTQLFLSILY
jgi:hypothetical protein